MSASVKFWANNVLQIARRKCRLMFTGNLTNMITEHLGIWLIINQKHCCNQEVFLIEK